MSVYPDYVARFYDVVYAKVRDAADSVTMAFDWDEGGRSSTSSPAPSSRSRRSTAISRNPPWILRRKNSSRTASALVLTKGDQTMPAMK